MNQNTDKRKYEHISISLEKDINTHIKNGFQDIELVHQALLTIDKNKISTVTKIFGREFSAPIIIGAMTGGHTDTKKINENLAMAARELNIPMGVGSQRAALENPELEYTYSIARETAPEIFLLGNLGLVQFSINYSKKEALRAIEMIKADALAIHLNPLQEAIQPEGDVNFENSLENLKELTTLPVPVIVKETGAGVSRESARNLHDAGIEYVDISGVGGTSFSAIEYYRQKDSSTGKTFWDWGIPSAISTIEVLETTPINVIASGGIRSGIEIAKSIALGAKACSIAHPLLYEAAQGDYRDIVKLINQIIEELKIAMFLVGAIDIESLKKSNLIVRGQTRAWLELRNIDVKKYANR